MKLTPMRYKDYTWPHNPETCRVGMERKIAVQKAPFGGYCLQDLGEIHRVMRGEGVFAGEGAYEQFRALERVFHQEGAGMLAHPVWQAMRARFVTLEVLEEPQPDYVRYSFEFWEEGGMTGMTRISAAAETAPGTAEEQQPGADDAEKTGPGEYHLVSKGETLWGISKRYGISLEQLLQLNPQIRNPNLIRPGDEVRVR